MRKVVQREFEPPKPGYFQSSYNHTQEWISAYTPF